MEKNTKKVIKISIMLILLIAAISTIMLLPKIKVANDKKEEKLKAEVQSDMQAIIDQTISEVQEQEEREATISDLKTKLEKLGYTLDETTRKVKYNGYEITIGEDLSIENVEKILTKVSYQITSIDKDKISILLIAEDTEYGIEEIQCPDGHKVYFSNKNKVALDYGIIPNTDNEFIVTNAEKEQQKLFIRKDQTDGLIQQIGKLTEGGNVKMNLTAGDDTSCYIEGISYNVNAIVHEGDMILDGQNTFEGATLSNNIYSFGSTSDVATSAGAVAKNTVALKVNGNLTINSGVTLTSVTSGTYGGPKGLIIYCTVKLTNNRTITMTSRGAKAAGENVYLWRNLNCTFEYVPSSGVAGGAGGTGGAPYTGRPGATPGAATGRRTGGGRRWSRPRYKWQRRKWKCRNFILRRLRRRPEAHMPMLQTLEQMGEQEEMQMQIIVQVGTF